MQEEEAYQARMGVKRTGVVRQSLGRASHPACRASPAPAARGVKGMHKRCPRDAHGPALGASLEHPWYTPCTRGEIVGGRRPSLRRCQGRYAATRASSSWGKELQRFRSQESRTVSTMARMFSNGVPACRLWQEQQIKPWLPAPNVFRQARTSRRTASGVPRGRTV
jgi:hypothetical protein